MTSYFLSYAHGDREDVERFLDVLKPELREFQLWRDTNILPGEKWRDEIAVALEGCRFGILCLTPKFLASEFIIREELIVLLAKPIVVPVGIQRTSFGERQVFLDSRGRTFDECGRKVGRRAFAAELRRQITALLEKYPC